MAQTLQINEWTGDFGREYTSRNLLTPEEHDFLYERELGIRRKELNRRSLKDVPKDARILEVGCNIGNQLVLLQEMGYTSLFGIEIQEYALEFARSRTRNISLKQGSAFDIPYPDGFFDLVFTSRVLIHVAIPDLPAALDEIHRCTSGYVWGIEYYSPRATEINYRGHGELLWKTDYVKAYLDRFQDLSLVQEERLPYVHGENFDTMFLLKKEKRTFAQV